MKNQYNFLKSIDTSNSASPCSNVTSSPIATTTTTTSTSQKLNKKGKLNKLQNLVATKISATNFVSQAKENLQFQATSFSSKPNTKLIQTSDKLNDNFSKNKFLINGQLNCRVANFEPIDNSETCQSSSEKMNADLSKCYDEIDLIYDYIRGLAPLPAQLRKIKSIDFEQLELEQKKLRLQQQHQHQQQQQQRFELDSSSQIRKQRPRQRIPDERRPRKIQGPLKLTVAEFNDRKPASVKRVESFNLAALNTKQPVSQQTGDQATYLIGSAQRGQPFRLPRAHSASTLNKPADKDGQCNSLGRFKVNLLENSARKLAKEQSATKSTQNSDSTSSESSSRLSSDSDGSSSAKPNSKPNNSSSSRKGNKVCIDKWTEKSHSDYENESASLSELTSLKLASSSSSTSSSASTNGSCSSANKATKSQKNSRTPSNGASKMLGSLESSSSGRPGSLGTKSFAECEPTGSTPKASQAPRDEHIYERIPAHRKPAMLVKSNAAHFDNGNFISSQQHQARRVGAFTRPFKHPVAYAANLVPMANLRPAYKNPIQTNLPLDQRHRLSISNLHLMPTYLTGPTMQQIRTYPNQLTQQAHLRRASSSSKVNKIKSLKSLSSGQMNDRMPKLLTRHQNHDTNYPQFPVKSFNRPFNLPILMWPMISTGTKQTHHNAQSSKVSTVNHLNTKTNKQRNSARRLTAIGIEHNLPLSNPSKLNLHELQNERLNSNSVSRSTSNRRTSLNESNPSKYLIGFEPKNLIEAPLIDEDEDDNDYDEQNYKENDINNRTSTNNKPKIDITSEESFSTNRKSTIHNLRLNSISDIHSFSSNYEIDSECFSQSSNNQIEQNNQDLNITKQKLSSNDKNNFISSSSFIKCYYGRDQSPLPQPKQTKETKTNQSDRGQKTSTGRKLLGLIGLDTSSSSNVATNANKETNTKQIKVKSSRQQNDKQSVIFLTGNSAFGSNLAPISSILPQCQTSRTPSKFLNVHEYQATKLNTRKAIQSNGVRHFEHPTVKIAKVPNSSAFRRIPASDGTNTSSSTSSYEAAIKNGRQFRADPEEQRPEKEGSPKTIRLSSSKEAHQRSSTAAAMMKVPKLSKQSHLLNRPLPKVPQQTDNQPSVEPTRRLQLPPARLTQAAQMSHLNQSDEHKSSLWRRSAPLVSTNLDLEASQQQQQQNRASLARSKSRPSNATGSLSLATQTSPTATTYTSSGISSRLTAATHLNSSVSGAKMTHKLKSGSQTDETKPSELTASLGREADFALLDADESDQLDQRSLSLNQTSARKLLAESEEKICSNLRLFDEKFSSNTLDQQVASSDDSLLESIDFSGTLSRKSPADSRRCKDKVCINSTS